MLAPCGRIEHAEHGHPVLDQRHGDAPAGAAAQIIAGAVDRVDHPDAAALDPVGCVQRLLRQPAGLRIERAQPIAQEGVHFEVDVADRVSGHLFPAAELAANAAQGDPASLPGDFGDVFKHRRSSIHRS
jgi:hypothetical protein